MFLEPPNETQLEFVKKEDFYRPAERLAEDVTNLVEWLSVQPHLPNITDRKWLTHFIIGCKYSLQRSKQVIDSYFIARAELPEFFGSFTREQLVIAMKTGTISLLPKLTPESHRILCIKTNPVAEGDKFDIMLFCRVTLGHLDLQLNQEPLYGHVFLYDLKHVNLSQLMAFTPTITKNLFRCCIDSFPIRLKAVHLMNAPKYIGRFLEFFKMFLPNKTKQRIFVHETLDDLYQYIPKDVLPDMYGGTGGNIDKIEEDSLDFMMAHKEWLEARPKADLSKRPYQKKTDELDMNGTFKKLQID